MRDAQASSFASRQKQSNPARFSPLIAGLFPPGVIASELRHAESAGLAGLLFPEEQHSLGHALPKRMREFTAGRLCARHALTELGFAHFPLHVTRDRRPCWPPAVIGSITHNSGFCGAVAASKKRFRAIGLDMETLGSVTGEIWPLVCTQEEVARLGALSPNAQARCATLIFSAKEAFYKCQYGLTAQWLEFHEVTLDIDATDLEAGTFGLRLLKPVAGLDARDTPFRGRFAIEGNRLLAGMVL